MYKIYNPPVTSETLSESLSKVKEDILSSTKNDVPACIFYERLIPADKAKEDSIETISCSMSDVWTKIKKASNEGQTHIVADITLDQEWVLMQLGYQVIDGYHTDSKETYRCDISWR